MSYELTILEGSTFCLCDEIGDLDGTTSGFFSDDTRFLSRLELRVNGARPLLLSSGKVEYYSAAFFLRNPVARGLDQDVLSISRERFVGEGMQDQLTVRNEGFVPLHVVVELEVGTDFADIISVKEHDFALGAPDKARPLPPPAAVRPGDGNQLVLTENGDGNATDAGDLLAARRAGRRLHALPDRPRAEGALGPADRRRRLAERRGVAPDRGRAAVRPRARARPRLARGVAA